MQLSALIVQMLGGGLQRTRDITGVYLQLHEYYSLNPPLWSSSQSS
jgi:hypothetical protein